MRACTHAGVAPDEDVFTVQFIWCLEEFFTTLFVPNPSARIANAPSAPRVDGVVVAAAVKEGVVSAEPRQERDSLLVSSAVKIPCKSDRKPLRFCMLGYEKV